MNTQTVCNELGIINPWPQSAPNVKPDSHGWFAAANQDMLNRTLTPEMRVLELGAWLGTSTRFIAQHCKHLITIDHWIGTYEEHTKENNDYYKKLYTLYNTFLVNSWHLKDSILPVRAWIQVGMDMLLEKGYAPDLIYIDAGHTYEDAKNDILKALQFPGNPIICGDDFRWGVDLPVQKAVKEVAKDNGFEIFDHGMYWRYLNQE